MRGVLKTAGLAALAAAMLGGTARAQDDEKPADEAKPAAVPGFIAHEWGTFTSFAGADGVNLEFSTHAGRDLPSFVYKTAEVERARYAELGKGTTSLQRMETP